MSRVREVELFVCDSCGQVERLPFNCACGKDAQVARFIRMSEEYTEPVSIDPPAEIVEAVLTRFAEMPHLHDDEMEEWALHKFVDTYNVFDIFCAIRAAKEKR